MIRPSVPRVREASLLLVSWLVGGILLIFVVFPVIRVLAYPGLEAYGSWLAEPRFQKAGLNSLLMLVLSTASSTLVGFVFAYALTRPRMPLVGLWRTVCLLPLFSPPFLIAFGYLLLLGRNGLVTHGIFGARITILGWPGLWLAQTISFFPVATMAIEQVLKSLPPSFDQAARNLGASPARQFWNITLPLALPGVAGAALMVAILVLADFGNPIMIAGDFSVLATEAWLRVQGWADLSGAAVLGTLLLVPSLLLFAGQRFWARSHAYVTITGKSSSLEPAASSRPERAVLLTVCLLVSVVVLAAYGALVLGAVVKGWGFDWSPTLRWVGELPSRAPELLRSLVFSLVAGAASALFAMVAAYLTTTRKIRGRRVLDLMCMLPAALPGIFVGIGYSIAFNRPPIDLYGTAAIIILSLMFWNISPGYQTGIEALKQISPSLGEAAANLGAGGLRALVDLYLPLLRGPFLEAFVLGFIRSITTLSVIVFVETSSNLVATFTIMNLVGDGYYGSAAALATALLVVSLATVALTRALFSVRVGARS